MENKQKYVGYLVRYLFPHSHTFRRKAEACLNEADSLESWQERIAEIRQEIHTHVQGWEPPTLEMKIARAKAHLAALEEQEDSGEYVTQQLDDEKVHYV